MKKHMFFDYAGLLFDCTLNDKTLYRSHKVVSEYLNNDGFLTTPSGIMKISSAVASEYFKERCVDKTIEWPLEKIVGLIFKNLDIPLNIQRLSAVCDIYKRHNHDYFPKKDVIATLPNLKNKYSLGIISNSTHNSLIGELKEYDLLHLFDTITFSYQIGVRKPHPKIYLSAMEKSKCEPKNAIFISHDQEELDGAKNVGMRTFLIDGVKNSLKCLEDLEW